MKNCLPRLLSLALLLVLPTHLLAANVIAPRQLLEIADFSPPMVSPDGRQVAVRVERASIERNTWDSAWYVLDMDGASPPRRVADGGVPLRDSAGIVLPMLPVWSQDGRWIYYRALLDGAIDVWRAAADGSGVEPLTRDLADARAFTLGADGRTLIYRVGATREQVMAAERAEDEQGIRIDETIPIGQGLYRSGAIEGRMATQRLDGWFDRVGLLADVPDRWRAVDLTAGSVRDLALSEVPAAAPAAQDLGRGSEAPWKWAVEPGGDRVALLTRFGQAEGRQDGPDIRLSMRSHARSRVEVECLAAACVGQAITGVQWRPGSDEVLYTVTDPEMGQAQTLYRWNVRTGAVLLVARSRGLLAGGRDPASGCGIASRALACVAATVDQPPRLVRIALESGETHTLFDPNAALARDMAETPVRLLRWTDTSGQAYTGQFYPARAMGGSPAPLFVTYYTCTGYVRGGLGDEWPLASLAGHGIAALCINRRPGYTLDAVARYSEGLSAVESAIDLLAANGEIDRARVGMGGLSFGTEVTMWTVMHSDLLRAASITSPLLTPTFYLFGSVKGDAFFSGLRRNWQIGAPDETPERWRALAPSSNLDAIRIPLLMQMPEQEYLYALDFAIPLVRARSADLYVFPNAAHQKFRPSHKLAAYQRNLDWFRYWLQGYERPELSAREQYVHWRAMKERGDVPQAADGGRADD
jgi:dipeptidyl aminopeptidase/acylaminoacyl peptidase